MRACTVFLALTACWLVWGRPALGEDKPDLAVMNKIRTEAFDHSQVMDTLFYLTDVNGPRVTNSIGFKSAADWVVKRLEQYGLVNVKEEPWGTFGRSWNLSHFEGHMLEPKYSPLIGFPLAWTSGTNGPVQGEAVLAVLSSPADFEKHKGQLRGKMVLTMAPKELELETTPLAHRFTQEELQRRAITPDPSRLVFGPVGPGLRRDPYAPTPPGPAEQRRFRERLRQFLIDEKPAVVVQFNPTASGGIVFGGSGGSPKLGDPIPPPTVVIALEHYNRIARLIEHKIPVKLEFDIRARFGDKAEPSFNVVGEIPGSAKKDELVMIGAHLDSWHGGTGATDNGTGASVAIETMRILKALHVQMDRTVRIALWSGEEQNLLGSVGYVKAHFADRADMRLKPEYSNLSAYYNDDTGTGKFRGIAVFGNDMARPIFEAWLEPFHDLGATAVVGINTPSNGPPWGSDFTSFEYAGLPGFNFLQDPMEYETVTHHSNMDLYDRVHKGDVMQAAAIEAAFAYNTAMRPEMMPRKAMPKPQPWPER
ncbi:MAG: M28 family peptidase [Bryobacteraceae bacterium]